MALNSDLIHVSRRRARCPDLRGSEARLTCLSMPQTMNKMQEVFAEAGESNIDLPVRQAFPQYTESGSLSSCSKSWLLDPRAAERVQCWRPLCLVTFCLEDQVSSPGVRWSCNSSTSLPTATACLHQRLQDRLNTHASRVRTAHPHLQPRPQRPLPSKSGESSCIPRASGTMTSMTFEKKSRQKRMYYLWVVGRIPPAES